MIRLGIDVGGTFTDLIALDPAGGLAVRKVLSTPPDFSEGVLSALDALIEEGGLVPADIADVAHGTTVATNALLTHTGARTGLITTRGFRDVLEFGRLRIPRLYDVSWHRPAPLVPRNLRLEVDERLAASGALLRPLDESSVIEAVRTLRAQQVESVAVSLLHSYRNPEHERRIATVIGREAPELSVSVSSQVLPEMREYERTSTTVVNAYIQPVVQRYLKGLVDGLGRRGLAVPLRVMQSNGGVVPPSAAAARPIHIIESGPAAGVVGALHVARRIGLADAISFDMGGTTAKACIIEGGRVNHARECEVGAGLNAGHRLLRGGGYLVRSPILDIAEVGAGGGSIARVEGGALKVGPASAGAVPGPVCYSRGGTEPTVTDANVVLGYLDPNALAGGSVALDAEAARRVIRDRIGAPLGLDLVAAAFGVHRIANAAMVRAIRAVSVERGRDPRKFALFAFGGGGPVHGANLAQSLEMSRVIIPPVPGLFSSLGLLWSAQEHHYARTFWKRFSEVAPGEVGQALKQLTTGVLQELEREGLSASEVELEASADVRYIGQNSDIAVSLARFDTDRSDLRALREAFEAEHEVQFGYRSPRESLQFTSLRLVARRTGSRSAELLSQGIRTGRPDAAGGGRRSIYFGPALAWVDTPVVGRGDLDSRPQQGPLAIQEYDSTTIVPPGAAARRDDFGNIVVELRR